MLPDSVLILGAIIALALVWVAYRYDTEVNNDSGD